MNSEVYQCDPYHNPSSHGCTLAYQEDPELYNAAAEFDNGISLVVTEEAGQVTDLYGSTTEIMGRLETLSDISHANKTIQLFSQEIPVEHNSFDTSQEPLAKSSSFKQENVDPYEEEEEEGFFEGIGNAFAGVLDDIFSGLANLFKRDDAESETAPAQFYSAGALGFAPEINQALNHAGAKHNVNPQALELIAKIESDGGTKLYNKYSKASGIFQVLPSTARGQRPDLFANKTDDQISQILINDNELNIDISLGLLKQKVPQNLEKYFGFTSSQAQDFLRELTVPDIYAIHQQGDYGGLALVLVAKGYSFSDVNAQSSAADVVARGAQQAAPGFTWDNAQHNLNSNPIPGGSAKPAGITSSEFISQWGNYFSGLPNNGQNVTAMRLFR